MEILGVILGVLLGWGLQYYQQGHERRKDARYRLLVCLRELQVKVGAEVAQSQTGCALSDEGQKYNDLILKLALYNSTQQIQNQILDVLSAHDDLPELPYVRKALWSSGMSTADWLKQLKTQSIN